MIGLFLLMHDFKLRQFLCVTKCQKYQICCHHMAILPSSKCTKSRFRSGLCPGHRWGTYDAPQTPYNQLGGGHPSRSHHL